MNLKVQYFPLNSRAAENGNTQVKYKYLKIVLKISTKYTVIFHNQFQCTKVNDLAHSMLDQETKNSDNFSIQFWIENHFESNHQESESNCERFTSLHAGSSPDLLNHYQISWVTLNQISLNFILFQTYPTTHSKMEIFQSRPKWRMDQQTYIVILEVIGN